ncbi:tRNA1(Val) (adenine(37)-N6)-methyltransferase [Paraglaciecola mesophila]|uniref:tRNA1(Val) (adenine(37)-N6)-methyltransferase n=1 Tax=Paraglaciecola mesophila TaxID=197222 RepID=A0A857JLN1_9ALTE|nr:methyltransferase [Paraglaciecola mesophila]QHJ12030.1 tRNA1(Val) (adenine(37)-N6)-methyltransferase [Paraglaciecola mesophila]
MKRQGFQFKQFFIEHKDCAMKVGTDSIMLGSWVTCPTCSIENTPQQFLDIGTGSGLLAVMLAQKSTEHTYITGIDIDSDAIGQAKRNMTNSPWSDKLIAQQTSLQAFQISMVEQKFTLIISNPPYFNSPLSTDERDAKKRIQARQTSKLTHQELLENVAQLLADDGTFYCVLPSDVCEAFIGHANTLGLHLIKQLTVFSKPNTPALRELLAFRFAARPLHTESLTIYTENHLYSGDYMALCKDYYLNF